EPREVREPRARRGRDRRERVGPAALEGGDLRLDLRDERRATRRGLALLREGGPRRRRERARAVRDELEEGAGERERAGGIVPDARLAEQHVEHPAREDRIAPPQRVARAVEPPADALARLVGAAGAHRVVPPAGEGVGAGEIPAREAERGLERDRPLEMAD